MKKLLWTVAVVVALNGACAARAHAQVSAQTLPPSDPTVITANGGEVCWGVPNDAGSIAIRVYGTFVATVAPRVRIGSDTNLTPPSGAISASSLTAAGILTITNQGWMRVCMVATAYTSGTVQFAAVAGGGNPGGSGGGAGDASLAEQQTQTALLTDIETDIDDIETSLAIIDNLVFGAGTAAAALRVTFASDAAPITLAAADADIGNVDLELAGTAVSATNPVAMRLSDGSAFVDLATDATYGTTTYTETTSKGPLVGMVRTDTPAALANTTNEVAPLAGSALNGLYTASASDPCKSIAVTTLPVSVAADTAVISATASKRTYICSGALIATAAEVVNIWEGTGTACGTSSAALAGSTTEANGMSLAANGGFVVTDTMRGISTNVDVCVRLSATNRVAGWLTYVQAP